MPPGGYTIHPKGQHARPQARVTLSATLCRVCCQHFINEAQTGQLPAQSHTANQEWGQTSDSGLPGHCRPPFPGGDYGLGGTEQGKHHGPHEPPSDHLVFLWHRALCGAAGPRDGGHGHGSRAEGADRPLGAGPQHHPVHPEAGCGGERPPPTSHPLTTCPRLFQPHKTPAALLTPTCPIPSPAGAVTHHLWASSSHFIPEAQVGLPGHRAKGRLPPAGTKPLGRGASALGALRRSKARITHAAHS